MLVSNPTQDPRGDFVPSTRDTLAAHVVAALIQKAPDSAQSDGYTLGLAAYQFADDMLRARVALSKGARP